MFVLFGRRGGVEHVLLRCGAYSWEREELCRAVGIVGGQLDDQATAVMGICSTVLKRVMEKRRRLSIRI